MPSNFPSDMDCVGNWQEICLVGSENFECAQKSPKILIKGGTVVNADHQQIADVYIEDGKIHIVAPDIKVLTYFLPSFQLLLITYPSS
jgi:hypothetical protein